MAHQAGSVFLAAADARHVRAPVRDFAEAERHLIERHERDGWFQRQFARCPPALSRHRRAPDRPRPGGHRAEGYRKEAASRCCCLRHLFADENLATASVGERQRPRAGVTWTPPPQGGAFAALLGLTGTGLLGGIHAATAARSPGATSPARLSVFGHERNGATVPCRRSCRRCDADAAAGPAAVRHRAERPGDAQRRRRLAGRRRGLHRDLDRRAAGRREPAATSSAPAVRRPTARSLARRTASINGGA